MCVCLYYLYIYLFVNLPVSLSLYLFVGLSLCIYRSICRCDRVPGPHSPDVGKHSDVFCRKITHLKGKTTIQSARIRMSVSQSLAASSCVRWVVGAGKRSPFHWTFELIRNKAEERPWWWLKTFNLVSIVKSGVPKLRSVIDFDQSF